MSESYNYKDVEEKWRRVWKEKHLYEVDIQNASNPFYNLWMFPYPSGARMHVGHAYASTGSDVVGRFKRMQGYTVFQPMGFDAFGIHGENYAIKVGEHPWKLMEDLCNRFRDEQFRMIGHAYDWAKEVRTYWPKYYKWTQWVFLQLLKHGLAERKTANVNWCPSCKTVLADEQVISGKCERCNTIVEQKELKQWFFKITKYADKLLDNLDHINWSKRIIEAQRNWIGKKEGVNIAYEIDGTNETVTCFTTRPDTNFGATFIVLAPEHDLVKKIITGKIFVEESVVDEIGKYVKASKKKTEFDRVSDKKAKTGVFTGLYAINRLTGKKMPVWVSDFVLGGYGTGAVVGVPGHDKRDFEFASKFGLEVVRVVVSSNNDKSPITEANQVWEEEGTMVNSGFLNGLDTNTAIKKVTDYLEDKGWGKRETTYRLRDWLISRQRYWSAPIPVVYCKKCGIVPVPEEELPVELPYVEDWKPKGDGRGPLANIPEFVNTNCPQCGEKAKRETDTLDNFLDSGWYFFRYPFVNRDDVPFAAPGVKGANQNTPNAEAFKKWYPVHLYIGGPEHAVLHLMYTRFLTMAFKDIGFFDFDEPFVKFVAHGHITMGGKKMSKSLGNIVNPDEYIEKVGADAIRIYLLFLGPFDQGGNFTDSGISGVTRFLSRVDKLSKLVLKKNMAATSADLKKLLHKTIKSVGEDYENLKFNTAIAKLMEFVNGWEKDVNGLSVNDLEDFIKIIAPLAPFISEEIYQDIVKKKSSKRDVNKKDETRSQKFNGDFMSVHVQSWPEYNENLIKDDFVTIAVQVNGKMRALLRNIKSGETEKNVTKMAKESVSKYINGKKICNIVYIPDKIVSFSVK